MPSMSYANKVLMIQLRNVNYGPDLRDYLTDNQLVFYVESRELGKLLQFHIIGPDLPLKKAVRYVYNYNDKVQKVTGTKSRLWKVALDFLNE